jgi:hypothetical protein
VPSTPGGVADRAYVVSDRPHAPAAPVPSTPVLPAAGPETWPPAHRPPPDYAGQSGQFAPARAEGFGITWKRVVAYLFLLVLFANMCAERFALGSLVLFLGGAFLVSLAWLIARAREGG